MDIYVASIAINDSDPTNRIVFSQIVNRFMNDLDNNNVKYDIDDLTDPRDYEKFNSIDEIPENHFLKYYIENLKDNGNWASWMYDANVFAIAYAGYMESTDIPLM